ncbi:hypothetical protein [Streptomyces sp. GB4-14]|uniref:hypothetical protein n=1 Tax=Streptomyces sp. GB4-14 TaxID=2498703 RepID=UPI003FD3D1FA
MLAPTDDATYQGYRVGIWLKNQRAAAAKRQRSNNGVLKACRLSRRPARCRRRGASSWRTIDPSWCPSWSVEWQRCFHLTRMHLSGLATRCP